MLHLIWVLIVGAVIGAIGSMIVGRDLPGGWIGNIVGGLVGAWVGGNLLGTWGPQVAGMAILPAIVGAMVVVFLVSMLIGATRRKV
ncbi:MAG: GlsB/YeaQ/YmgE family stress response membrane protein [Lactobacillus sp.]|nr:GlsB/YeaQ/YmgE family stress response membrane protein [Lactobacillus sp.]MCI2032932.1 GlsB/YeaQ/YmgE family stress response membrane protein [Lactobacillus sp.]